jgi:hypothetical protein
MAIAGTSVTLNSTEGHDKITITEKVTSPYFSDGSTELLAANILSESISDTNEVYYFGIANSNTTTTTEFHVAYGHVDGNGGNDESDAIKSPTSAIYKQFASLLLPAQEVTGGFFISDQGSEGVKQGAKDDDIYVLIAERANMKDRINKENWTIALSGSTPTGAGSSTAAPLLQLTDDSKNDDATPTPVGDRYNIVSGTDGTIVKPATEKTYGFYYPDQGILVFSAAELSSSIPGKSDSVDSVVQYKSGSQIGFHRTTNQDANYQTALRFINCLTPTGAKLKFRDEEDQVSVQYFCRAKAGQFNFSNNPTFVSGSDNELRHTSMKGNPTTFISGVQLYNSSGDIVAVGNLSTPVKKNFSSEVTIKTKLTY